MKKLFHILIVLFFSGGTVFGQSSGETAGTRIIEFPGIPGYQTLICDFHIHTVLSDGSVWPDIRVQEAWRDGLDAISITDHIEYQPHQEDIPHSDRNRSYELAKRYARNNDLLVINGAEITRAMPPGHFNAIFLKDVNKLNQEDVMEVFREAKRQGAFVFWNHPHWTSQQPDGIASLKEMHYQLLEEQLLDGMEIYNEHTYSDEALQIALDQDLTLMGNSDIHGLIDWTFSVPEGGHRPVTLVFASEKSEEALQEALFAGRTAVWFDNSLVGNASLLVPLIQGSLEVKREKPSPVQRLTITNHSDADYILENTSPYTLHANGSVVTVKAHGITTLQVKTEKEITAFNLTFRVLNAYTAPGAHPEITLKIQ